MRQLLYAPSTSSWMHDSVGVRQAVVSLHHHSESSKLATVSPRSHLMHWDLRWQHFSLQQQTGRVTLIAPDSTQGAEQGSVTSGLRTESQLDMKTSILRAPLAKEACRRSSPASAASRCLPGTCAHVGSCQFQASQKGASYTSPA